MGWFSNKKEKGSESKYIEDEDLPQLPELPSLPPLPEHEDQNWTKLPSVPSNSYGQKFSENAIKEAVGEMPEQKGSFTLEEPEINMQRPLKTVPQMKLPSQKSMEIPEIRTAPEREQPKEVPYEFKEAAKKVKDSEPVFVRIDKFQKALDILEEAKGKIESMRKNLYEIKQIKEEEEAEITSWDSEINNLKSKIDKIDSDLFSKVG